jgi:selenocysteine lyase/cysteine desulfurase
MFGWPTGVGCLLARRDALARLERPWFSGDTIVAAFVQREWYQSAPGAFTISRETLVGDELGEGMTLDDYIEAIGLPSGGAVRASLGLASNVADIERFTAFARKFVDLAEVLEDLPPRTAC